MRPASLLILLACLAAVPALALAARTDSGHLSISDGRGLVTVKGRGTVIGRVDVGRVTVTDLTPADATEPLIFNCDQEAFRGSATVCTGDKLRFRMVGGGWKIQISGSGIDLSAAARGTVFMSGDSHRPGVYSVTGVDCRTEAQECLPLPWEPTTIVLAPLEP